MSIRVVTTNVRLALPTAVTVDVPGLVGCAPAVKVPSVATAVTAPSNATSGKARTRSATGCPTRTSAISFSDTTTCAVTLEKS